MILLLLLTPVLALLNQAPDLGAILNTAQKQLAAAAPVQDISERSAWLTYKLLLEERIQSTALEMEGVLSCVVHVVLEQNPNNEFYGMPSSIRLTLKVDSRMQVEQARATVNSLQEIIHATYGVKTESISIDIKR
jgi:type III secretory pathway lipoprotein EscJ